MVYKSPEEIFSLLKHQQNRIKAKRIYDFIFSSYDEVEIVSLRGCISIAKKGYIKFATITPHEGEALLLHFPQQLRDEINNRKDSYNIRFDKAKRDLYVNQIDIKLEDITSMEDLEPLITVAYKNPRRPQPR